MIEASAAGRDWELSKENIQPLSSGRKMSFLTHSLDRTDDAELARIHQEMEKQIVDYEGPDPIEPWCKYIEFLEQSCTTGGKTNSKYETTLNKCFQAFAKSQQYRDDRRFVEICIKAVQNFSASKRAEMLQGFLGRGYGLTVSRIYLAIADAFESTQNIQDAVKVLNRGIEARAQPIEYLQDALKNLQFRVAQKLAQGLQQDDDSIRNFGASVPTCKITNEAQNIRVALSPGNPSRARPIFKQKTEPKIAIFQGFNNADSENADPQSTPLITPMKENEIMQSEQENIIKPKKWCNEYLPPPPAFIAENLPPVEIYVEEPENQPRKEELTRKIAKGILSERTIPDDPPVNPIDANEKNERVMYRKKELIQGKDREISYEHLRAKEYLRKVGVTTLKALISVEKKVGLKTIGKIAPPKAEVNFAVPTGCPPVNKTREDALLSHQRLLQEKEELEKEILELKKDNKEKAGQLQEQQGIIARLEEIVATAMKSQEAAILERNEIAHFLSREEMERTRLAEENEELQKFLMAEKMLVERLRQEQDALRQYYEDEKLKLIQEFERERNESLLSFKIDHRSMVMEEEKITITTEVNRTAVASPPFKPQSVSIANPIPVPQKLGFTLYESNMENFVEEDQPVNLSTHSLPAKSLVAGDTGGFVKNTSHYVNSNKVDFVMPAPPPKQQIKPSDENKENVSADSNRLSKQSRPLNGILVPSTSAEPMELIYQDEDEDEVLMKNPEGTIDFNVTDLTRALQLYPRPLTNSTPEKMYSDETCPLPIDMNINRRRRPFAATPLETRKMETDLPAPVIQDALRMNLEPLNYDDEQPPINPKDNSFNGKADGVSYAPEYINHLSPIAEGSKERWSSCTSSSSSTNMTNTRGTNYSVGSSYNVTKSVPRIVGRFPGHRSGDAFQPHRHHTFDNNS